MVITWQEDVYGKKDKDGCLDDYYSLKNQFMKKFRYTCQACRKRYSKKSGNLSLHHIVPRDMGGKSDWDNLILLCKPCHNEVEANIEKFGSYHEIEYAFNEKAKPKIKQKPKGKNWQSWVYGGASNPIDSEPWRG